MQTRRPVLTWVAVQAASTGNFPGSSVSTRNIEGLSEIIPVGVLILKERFITLQFFA